MAAIFTAEYKWLWAVLLALALFFPVRRFIWLMQIRRAVRTAGEDAVDDAERQRLKRRAGATSALMCALFSFLYVQVLFAQ